jgi:type I restriction enzyme S subunit
MNRTLEEMARAIFKSWFVDFDPVHAKAAVRSAHPGWTNEQISRAACPNLKPEIAALFPDSFVDSELGEIPEGWKIGAVQDLGEVICGKTPPTTDRDNYGGDVPFVTIPDMHGKVFVTSTEKKLSEKGVETQKGKSLPPFSICVSCIATPGLVVLTSTQCQTNQQINSVIPSDSRTSIFCFFSLRELGERIRTHGAGGSVLLNLNKGLFSSMRILLPPREAYAFQNIAKSILEKVLNNEKEIEILAGIRDTLLPKLISGELRVKDAEKFVERVAI